MTKMEDNQAGEARVTRLVPLIFTLTIFLSASLLFFVQPLFAKIALPQIGGASAVWTTAMLFFQTILICGYAYAHMSTRYLPVAGQVMLHMTLWALALLFLPLAIRTGVSFDADTSVALQTLLLFSAGVGAPFAVLAANAPLIQSWYAKTGGPSSDDPYFLYGASNLGSLGALLAFPLLAEPLFGAAQIGQGWAIGFVVLGGFLVTSGLAAKRGWTEGQATPISVRATYPGWPQTMRWLLLAFIPSSMMLSITAKISRDVGAFPLIWVVPLAIYLLTFVLTFSNRPLFGANAHRWMLAAGMAYLSYFLGQSTDVLYWSAVGFLLLAFFGVAMVAHRALYESRPDQSQLTYFYMIMSVGGAFGGLFNSIIAPTYFNDLYELRVIVIVAVVLFVINGEKLTKPVLLRDLTLCLVVMLPIVLTALGLWPTSIFPFLHTTAIFLGLAVLMTQIIRQTVVLTIIIVLTITAFVQQTPAKFRDRSFFGAHSVIEANGAFLYGNGNTLHGMQLVSEYDSARPTPTTYYHHTAPIGQIMTSSIKDRSTDIGIVGLGVGSLACYAEPNQNWQFYEIDALVDRVARDPSLFTYMSSCAGEAPTHLGDARVVLEQQIDIRYDILVIDAFSSDSVPLHLITEEAITLFFERLKPGGLLVLHISNRYYELSRPLARIADGLGLKAKSQYFNNEENLAESKPSKVVIMARDPATLAEFDADPRWTDLKGDGQPGWTDDYANVLSALILPWH